MCTNCFYKSERRHREGYIRYCSLAATVILIRCIFYDLISQQEYRSLLSHTKKRKESAIVLLVVVNITNNAKKKKKECKINYKGAKLNSTFAEITVK